MPAQTIVEICRTVHGRLNDSTIKFAHGDKEWQNLIVDNVLTDEKILYLDEPIRSLDTITANSRIIPEYPLSFVFGGKTDLDWTPAQHQAVIAEQRNLARKYVLLLLQERDSFNRLVFEKVSGMSRIDFINLFDANMSGCYLELRLKPLSPETICV